MRQLVLSSGRLQTLPVQPLSCAWDSDRDVVRRKPAGSGSNHVHWCISESSLLRPGAAALPKLGMR